MPITGAGVHCPLREIDLRINACGIGPTNTINRAELSAIGVALEEMGEESDETIATDSQIGRAHV